jgi:RimJ/RimL family protein N-acetyltransferase
MQTQRLHLRRPRDDDLEPFLAYRNDPWNLRLQPIAPMPADDALRFLQAQSNLDSQADACWIMFALERRQDARLIGEVGIYLEAAARREGDIGWSLHRDHCGQGYAAEAAQRLLEYAFTERGLLRVTASMSAHNTASARLCRRLGMRLESTTPQAQCVAGQWHDVDHYVLTRGD